MVAIILSLLICATVVAPSHNSASHNKLKFTPVRPLTTAKPLNNLPIVLEVHKNDGFAHAPGKDSAMNLRYTALTQEDLRKFQPSIWFKSLMIAKVA